MNVISDVDIDIRMRAPKLVGSGGMLVVHFKPPELLASVCRPYVFAVENSEIHSIP